MPTAEFFLRPFELKDVDSIAKHANNIKVSQNLRDQFPYPYSKQDAENFIKSLEHNANSLVYAIEVDGKAAGAIGLLFQTDIYKKTMELGYWLGEEYWNKGIATAAVKEIVNIVFKNYNVNKLYARVFEYNTASAKVLIKNGFVLEARLKKQIVKNDFVMDELIYARYAENREKNK